MAIVNHGNRYIFFHIPKTAGTSIRKFLLNYASFGKSQTFPSHTLPSKVRRDIPTISFFKGVEPDIWDYCFKFAFMRDPYDRLYSIYKYYKWGFLTGGKESLPDHLRTGIKESESKGKGKLPSGKEVSDKMHNSFEDFVLDIESQMRVIGFPETMQHQSLFLDEDVDFIGRFEKIKDDMDYIIRKLNSMNDKQIIQRSNEIYHMRVSVDLSDDRVYTQEMSDIVEEYFKEDIRLYNDTSRQIR